MRRLEKITRDYWEASKALRHPDAPQKSVGDVLKLLHSSDRLRPEEWRLRDLMHVVRFDIVEANTKWRENPKRNAPILELDQFRALRAVGYGREPRLEQGTD